MGEVDLRTTGYKKGGAETLSRCDCSVELGYEIDSTPQKMRN
jgi:hypothetical protein